MQVDLNSDMGEAYGAWTGGDDEAILKVVTSANVACGFHAGDPQVMARTFAEARAQGVAVGAHPGYADLSGFGRRVLPHTTEEIERFTAYQIGAAQAVAALAGHRITYVKAHGALANLAASEADVAAALARAVKAVDPDLTMLCIACTAQVGAAETAGLKIAHEIFADRAYDDEGLLVSRSLPGAVLHDTEAAAARVVRMLQDGALETVTGKRLKTPIDSICVHSDTPSAVEMARGLRRTLEADGVTIRAFTQGHPGGHPTSGT